VEADSTQAGQNSVKRRRSARISQGSPHANSLQSTPVRGAMKRMVTRSNGTLQRVEHPPQTRQGKTISAAPQGPSSSTLFATTDVPNRISTSELTPLKSIKHFGNKTPECREASDARENDRLTEVSHSAPDGTAGALLIANLVHTAENARHDKSPGQEMQTIQGMSRKLTSSCSRSNQEDISNQLASKMGQYQDEVQQTSIQPQSSQMAAMARNMIGRLRGFVTEGKGLVLGPQQEEERTQLRELTFQLHREIEDARWRGRGGL